MIYTETINVNGRQLVRTYSDMFLIERNGTRYSEAIDPINSRRTYTETNERIPYDMTETEQKAAAYDILTGVSE